MYNILYIEQSDPKGYVVVVDNKAEDKNKKMNDDPEKDQELNKKMNDEPEKDQEGKMATCESYLRKIKIQCLLPFLRL